MDKKNLKATPSSKIPDVEPDFPGTLNEHDGPIAPDKDNVSVPESETPEPYTYVDESVCKLIAGLIPFGILAVLLKREEYNLTPAEADSLTLEWDRIIAKYLPTWAGAYGPESSLITHISLLLIGKSGILDKPKEENGKTGDSHYVPILPPNDI